MSALPERPVTKTLDALWAQYGIGAARYTKAVPPGVGWTDGALQMYGSGVDWKNEPIDPKDLEKVEQADVLAARKYLADVWEASKQNGGYTPGEGPNEQESTRKQDLQVPVAIGAPIPDAPKVEVPTEHHEHAEGWLSKVGHAVTPENIETVASVLSALSKLFGKKRS